VYGPEVEVSPTFKETYLTAKPSWHEKQKIKRQCLTKSILKFPEFCRQRLFIYIWSNM
jgi:hypothetical protein